jgi:hypothetical protein
MVSVSSGSREAVEIIAMTVTARLFALFGWLALSVLAQTHAADLGKQVTGAGLDPSECYRVHDIEISKEDARFYLTDGYLMFGKPVNGGPVTAVFSADTDGGDAEVLLLPPDRSERKSMAGYAGAPNLNEHFTQAAFIFTDDTARSILEQIKAGDAKKYPDIGALLETRWGQIVANLMSGFESRIVLDLVTLGASKGGFFEAVIQGRKLGNFDVTYDARAYEQLVAGQITNRNGTTWWDTWTSFQSRSHRGLPPPLPEEQILSYRIDVTLDASLTMHCVTRMRILATADSRTALAFDLTGQMRATAAKVDGASAEVYERDSVRSNPARSTRLRSTTKAASFWKPATTYILPVRAARGIPAADCNSPLTTCSIVIRRIWIWWRPDK